MRVFGMFRLRDYPVPRGVAGYLRSRAEAKLVHDTVVVEFDNAGRYIYPGLDFLDLKSASSKIRISTIFLTR